MGSVYPMLHSSNKTRQVYYYLFTCTCIGIHPGRVEPIELTMPRTEVPQVRRSCASSLETFTQSEDSRSRSALIVVVRVFSWPLVRMRHVQSGVGGCRFLVNSLSGRLAWLRPGWKILPTRIGYCSNTNGGRRFGCEDNNVAFTFVQPLYCRVRQVEPKQQQRLAA